MAAPQLIHVRMADPRTEVVLTGLRREAPGREADSGLRGPEELEPPDGGFVLVLDEDLPVAGGGYCRHDWLTAELAVLWTAPWRRREGLARRVLDELGLAATGAGYARIVASAGPDQPEAQALYRSAGYAVVAGRRAIGAQARLVFARDLRPRLQAEPGEPVVGRAAAVRSGWPTGAELVSARSGWRR